MFFWKGDEKFFVRGFSYGPFRANGAGDPFPEREQFERDLGLLGELGANTLRLYHVPPQWLRDSAEAAGIHLLVSVPWSQHLRFLDSRAERHETRRRMKAATERLRGSASLLALLIGNEIPPEVVRWYGPKRVGPFLASLADEIKQVDPEALVSYGNFPTTEYLEVDGLDFLSFNVYLHDDGAFRRYIARLQNLADYRPLLLTEFGIDSMGEGEAEQARILPQAARTAAAAGCAGTVVFSFTDEWHTGGHDIEDWAFGVVTRDRRPKPVFEALKALAEMPPLPETCPKVSVVICAYNAERTMEECLTSLRGLHYPDYEVIVVDDGSTDSTREIAERYPEFKLISRENRGLAESRNDGILAATGEIVAFTDSDCAVDPDWLTFLVHRLASKEFAGVGGPNLPPPETDWVPECVARAPGGPTHILLTDWEAEHVPGCNMAFWREPLIEVGMFDPVYTSAGDDVDICWELQNAGYKIGFAASALVWHRRRHTVSAYLRQQRGYGRAESQLYFAHPFRFNRFGHSRWLGRIYGDFGAGMFARRRPIIYGGPFGSALFQTLYEPPSSLLRYLPSTLEWSIVAAFLTVTGLVSTAAGRPVESFLVAGLIMFVLSVTQSLVNARAVDVRGLPAVKARLLIALLHYAGPLVRSIERVGHRIQGLSQTEEVRFPEVAQRVDVNWLDRSVALAFWTETGVEKSACVDALSDFLRPRKYAIALDNGWNPWDVRIQRGPWVRTEVNILVEEHGGTRRQVDARACVRTSAPARFVVTSFLLGAVAAAATGMSHTAFLLGAASIGTAAFIAYEGVRLARTVYRACQISFVPLGLNSIR
jgi:glycosyltransferase involved in cell wall biosynthesis